MSERALIVPSAVREAFGVDGDAVALPGREGLTVRIGDVVLKRVHDVAEAEWTADLQSRMAQDGSDSQSRCPRSPVGGRTGTGQQQGSAGLRPVAPAWQAVTAIGLRFSNARSALTNWFIVGRSPCLIPASSQRPSR